jgi:hypothetical protein
LIFQGHHPVSFSASSAVPVFVRAAWGGDHAYKTIHRYKSNKHRHLRRGTVPGFVRHLCPFRFAMGGFFGMFAEAGSPCFSGLFGWLGDLDSNQD